MLNYKGINKGNGCFPVYPAHLNHNYTMINGYFNNDESLYGTLEVYLSNCYLKNHILFFETDSCSASYHSHTTDKLYQVTFLLSITKNTQNLGADKNSFNHKRATYGPTCLIYFSRLGDVITESCFSLIINKLQVGL